MGRGSGGGVESACGNVDKFAFSCMIMQNTGV